MNDERIDEEWIDHDHIRSIWFCLLLSITVGGGAVDGVGDDGGQGVNGGSVEVGDPLQPIVLNSFGQSTEHLSCSSYFVKSFPYYKLKLPAPLKSLK